MKKTLVAIAALAATSAFAQSAVTLSGQLDAGIYSVKNLEGSDKKATVMGDGVTFSNVLGFKGVEDLGGGQSAGFDLVADLQINNGDTNAAGTFRRAANVNYESATAGKVQVGITTNPIIATNGALMPTGANGNAVATTAAVALGYADFFTKNAVTYTSPNIMGVVAQYQKGFSNDTADSANGSVSAYSLAYVNGPLEIRYAAQDRKPATAAIAATAPNGSTAATAIDTYKKKSSVMGVKYTVGAWSFGAAKLASEGQLGYAYGGVAKNVAGSVAERTGTQLGAAYTQGAWTYGVSRTTAEESSLTTLQARYALSKRTNVIGTYGSADNKGTLVGFNAIGFNTGTTPATILNAAAMGPTADKKTSAMGVGITHSF